MLRRCLFGKRSAIRMMRLTRIASIAQIHRWPAPRNFCKPQAGAADATISSSRPACERNILIGCPMRDLRWRGAVAPPRYNTRAGGGSEPPLLRRRPSPFRRCTRWQSIPDYRHNETTERAGEPNGLKPLLIPRVTSLPLKGAHLGIFCRPAHHHKHIHRDRPQAWVLITEFLDCFSILDVVRGPQRMACYQSAPSPG